MPRVLPIVALLPPDASLRGNLIDGLWVGFGVVVVAALLIVHLALLAAWLRPRRSGGGKGATFAWSGAALLGLVGLFVASDRTWERLKAERNADAAAANVQRVYVIGERFAWSVVGPGPDGVLGEYLDFPEETDDLWPATADGPVAFRGVAGPAALPEAERAAAVAAYVETINPLGKNFADPAGLDDEWQGALGREIVVEANRPVEVWLGSKDAIHDFFVPALRVKMDAVPGLTGKVRFTPTTPGRYDLLCAEFCGWGHFTMTGTLVVTPGETQ